MKLGRRELLLGALLLLLVVVVGRQILTTTGVVGGKRAAQAETTGLEVALVQIAALPDLEIAPVEVVEAYEPKRNLFEFSVCRVDREEQIRRQKEQDEIRKKREEIKLKRQEAAKEEALAARVARAEQPPVSVAPNPQFAYIGYIGRNEDPYAVFQPRGQEDEVILAKKGEVVGDSFVVKIIEWDRVELGFTDPEFSKEKPKVLPLKGVDS